MTAENDDPADTGSLRDKADADRPRVVTSEELFEGNRELWIEHAGEMYRLRITTKGNLYLTK
jgi:hemin uptake protein HemP